MAVANGRGKRFGFLDRKRERERDGGTIKLVADGDSSAGSSDESGTINSTVSDSGGVGVSPEPSGVSPNPDTEDGNGSVPLADSSTPDGRNRGDGGDSPDRGSGGDGTEPGTGDVPKRRGRHPADCNCPKHGNGNLGDGEETGKSRKESKGNDPESSPVDFADLFGFGAKGKKSKPEAAVASLFKMAFDVASFSPLGQHWAISATEAMNLGRYTVAAIDTVSPSAKAKFSRIAEKNLPWIALAVTGAVITIPRVQMTREMIRLQREQMALNPTQNGGNPNNVPERENLSNPSTGVGKDKRTPDAKAILGAGASIVDGNFNPEIGHFVSRPSGRVV